MSVHAQDAQIKPCGGNAYCNNAGKFYSDRLLCVGRNERVVVGACWFESVARPQEPARFVCSRCAHRSLFLVGESEDTSTWLLRCPFDGEPLGRGAATVLLDPARELLETFASLPPEQELSSILLGRDSGATAQAPRTDDECFARAIKLYRGGDFKGALGAIEQLSHPVRADVARLGTIIRSRALEKLGRGDEARPLLESLRGGFTS